MPVPSWKYVFEEGSNSAALLREWYEGLQGNKGERARLRRCAGPGDAMLSPAYHRLLHLLKDAGYGLDRPHEREALAGAAGLAARVKADASPGTSFARQMAEAVPGSGRARVSGLRFRRILAEEKREDLYLLLVRVIHLLDGNINLTDMARGFCRWDEGVRRQWAYDYYASAPKDEK